MESTEILRREHDVIERGINLLEAAVGLIEANKPVANGFPSWIVQFIRNFADRCHHAKEEDELFPLLEQRGIPREGGPIGCMLQEHETGRDCVRRMDEATAGDAQDLAAFAVAASQYISLLREHISKENNVLFPMAEHCLSPQDDAELLARFKAAEEAKDLDVHQHYVAELEQWEELFGGAAPA